MPKNHQEAIEMALSLATSCLTCYCDPQGTTTSYLPSGDNGHYASEVIDNITYLRLANFETHHE